MKGAQEDASSSQGREPNVIYISQEQLKEVEYLIHQSIQGNHILFDSDTIRSAFLHSSSVSPLNTDENSEPSDEDCYSVEHHIESLISKPSLPQKRAYLDRLDTETRQLVIRTYFNIVENSLYDNLGGVWQ